MLLILFFGGPYLNRTENKRIKIQTAKKTNFPSIFKPLHTNLYHCKKSTKILYNCVSMYYLHLHFHERSPKIKVSSFFYLKGKMNPKGNSLSPQNRPHPPGRVKLANALRELLRDKEFDAITTSEIAGTAGVNEALIYRYFGDKRGLLHQILSEFLDNYVGKIEKDLAGITGPLERLRRLVWLHIRMYESNRVFAKLLLLEVRSFPGYFGGHCYAQVKRYSDILLDILEKGVASGEIRDDIPIRSLRQVVIGGIEHLCLPEVIFDRDFSVDQLTEDLCNTLYRGIARQQEGRRIE